MTPVTPEQFFAALSADPRDIMPTIAHATYDQTRGYRAEWRDRAGTGTLFGVSEGGTTFMVHTYSLVQPPATGV